MLSLFRGRGAKSTDRRVDARKSKRGENPLLHSRKVSDSEGKVAQDIVLNEADRKLYRYDLPTTERGFGDLLDDHDGEGTFPYAAITDEPSEEYDARVRRITNLQPRINKRRLDVPDHISVKLYKEVEEFPISSVILLSEKKHKIGNFDYILIKRVVLILTPLSSFVDSHSDVIVTLCDMRKRTNKTARSMTLQDNKQYKGEFALDYCFPKESAQKVSLSFAQEVPTFDTGEQWGACQIFLELEESDYPQVVAFQETIASASLTTSMLERFKHDPAHINLAIRESHRMKLQDLYLRGQISDETEAVKDKTKKVSYARSSGAGLKAARRAPKQVQVSQDGEVDWSAVTAMEKPQQAEDQVSVEPSQDGFEDERKEDALTVRTPPRSAMKQSRVGFREEVEVIPRTEVQIDGEEKDDGIPVGYSPQVSDNDDEGSVPIRVSRLSRIKLPD